MAKEQNQSPKKRHHVVRNVLIVVAVVIVAFIAIAAMGGSESVKPSSKPFDPNNYQRVSYTTVARTPDSYKDQNLVFTGKVIQVLENSGETDLRIATSSDGYSDIVFVRFDPSIMGSSHILEDDTVTVYGRCTGQETYDSIFGQQISIPGMVADHIDVKG